jgi:isopenicillin-N epimerase
MATSSRFGAEDLSFSPGLGRRGFLKTVLTGTAVSAAALSRLNASIYESLGVLNERHLGAPAPDGAYWEALKRHFLFQDDLIMMNNGTVGPMPRPVFNTLMKYFRMQVANPYDVYNYLPTLKEAVRVNLAAFIGAAPDETVLTSNTTEGINLVAQGLDLAEGDEVLMTNLEHPGGINPWKIREKRHGIVVREIPVGVPPKSVGEFVEAFARALTPKTRVIFLSHTVYMTGLIAPLKEISRMAHEKGILVAADSAHGLGMLDLNMKDLGVDFFASSPYKWMGAPTGIGLLYIRKEIQDRLWPTIVSSGWDAVQTGARRFDPQGQRADAMVMALGEALEFQNVIGKARIARRIRGLAAHLKSGLKAIPGVTLHTPEDPYLSAGLTVFSLKGVNSQAIVDYVREKHNLVIRTVGIRAEDITAVRVSTPIYISTKEVDMVLAGVRHFS